MNLEITAIPRLPGTLKIATAIRGVTADESAVTDRDRLTVKVAPPRPI